MQPLDAISTAWCLQEHKQLPFWGPAYTAHLEVDYKAKINAGSTILCTCSVESMEGRKVWMQATISDGPTGALGEACCVSASGCAVLAMLGRRHH